MFSHVLAGEADVDDDDLMSTRWPGTARTASLCMWATAPNRSTGSAKTVTCASGRVIDFDTPDHRDRFQHLLPQRRTVYGGRRPFGAWGFGFRTIADTNGMLQMAQAR